MSKKGIFTCKITIYGRWWGWGVKVGGQKKLPTPGTNFNPGTPLVFCIMDAVMILKKTNEDINPDACMSQTTPLWSSKQFTELWLTQTKFLINSCPLFGAIKLLNALQNLRFEVQLGGPWKSQGQHQSCFLSMLSWTCLLLMCINFCTWISDKQLWQPWFGCLVNCLVSFGTVAFVYFLHRCLRTGIPNFK